jgi:4,5-DOPA dioxygenase extradiol
MMATLPTLFISHGAPTFAIEPGIAGRELEHLVQHLPRPRAILIASPHWMTPTLSLTGHPEPETIHDFGGFDKALYAIQYPAPGAPAIATRAAELLTTAGFAPRVDANRGRDHGAWVPMLHMYPAADIPVIQISMQPNGSPEHYFHLGRALAPLRSEGVLIIGSGSLTHNLYEFGSTQGKTLAYVTAFAEWIAAAVRRMDSAALFDYRRQAPHAEHAHPTDEHLMPLMFAMGAAGAHASVQRLAADDVRYGMLAMDIYRFDGAVA